MTLENRIFLRWDEAAQLLGMDREGLRQALLYQWSPTRGGNADKWLPVMLTLPRGEYMTTLQFDRENRQPDIFWNGRDTYYRNCEGKSSINFSDGSSLPLRGGSGGFSWDADHGHGCGWGHTFSVGGERLVISPETVANACAANGYIGGLAIAPIEWCADGFPFDQCFVIVDCDNTYYESQPRDLFDSAVFLRSDITRMSAGGAKVEDKPIDERERTSLLRIIRSLVEMTKLPGRGAATPIEKQLQQMGFAKPGEATIRKVIEQARALEPDDKPQ
jgi:hypothetical protein